MGDTRFNERAWLAWLLKVRVIVISALLAVELLIARLTPNNVNVRLFETVIVVWFTVSFFFMFLVSLWQETKHQAIVQIFTDLAFITALVYVTGGIDTFFNFLYPLAIIVASVLLPRYWAYLTAAVSFICFGALLELIYFERIPSFQFSARGDLRSLQIVIIINFCAYLAVHIFPVRWPPSCVRPVLNFATKAANCSAFRHCMKMSSIPFAVHLSPPILKAGSH